MKKKIVRRRRRKSSKNSTNHYFNINTHNAIISWQGSEDNLEKEKLYVAEIKPAFDKLAENLIFIHGFAKIHGSYEDLRSDCVTFLYETLHKFDHTRGTKAFSYFNVVAKNWLIISSKKKLKSIKRSVSIDDLTALNESDYAAIENHSSVPSPDRYSPPASLK